jgi:hypothetical protein
MAAVALSLEDRADIAKVTNRGRPWRLFRRPYGLPTDTHDRRAGDERYSGDQRYAENRQIPLHPHEPPKRNHQPTRMTLDYIP